MKSKPFVNFVAVLPEGDLREVFDTHYEDFKLRVAAILVDTMFLHKIFVSNASQHNCLAASMAAEGSRLLVLDLTKQFGYDPVILNRLDEILLKFLLSQKPSAEHGIDGVSTSLPGMEGLMVVESPEAMFKFRNELGAVAAEVAKEIL